MAKSYPDQLAEWIRKREASGRDKNLVAFHAVKDDVKTAMDAGYAVKTIWAHMSETKRVGFGYETFLGYVHRLLKPSTNRRGIRSGERMVGGQDELQRTDSSTSTPSPTVLPTPSPPDDDASGADAVPPKMATFKFNPIPKVDR